MGLNWIQRWEWFEPHQQVEALAELAAVADDATQREAFLLAWLNLSTTLRRSPTIFEGLAATPAPLQREIARAIAERSNHATAQVLAAAIELGGTPALRRVNAALDRTLYLQFRSFEEAHRKLAKTSEDALLVRVVARAFQRLLPLPAPVVVTHANADVLGLLLNLFSVLAIGGEAYGADPLLGAMLAVDEPAREAHFFPRLEVERARAHVQKAKEALSGGLSPSPLPFLDAPEPTVPTGTERRASAERELHANLQLAVLQAAIDAGRAVLPDPEPGDDPGRSARVRAKLLAVEVPADFMGSLERLLWSGTEDVAFAISPDDDGESDAYDIDHLDRIDRLPELRALHLDVQSGEPSPDLTPLAALTHLEELTWRVQVQELRPLLGLPRLRAATLRHDDTDENREVLATLAARGVVVKRY